MTRIVQIAERTYAAGSQQSSRLNVDFIVQKDSTVAVTTAITVAFD